jgi:hypothetical protein
MSEKVYPDSSKEQPIKAAHESVGCTRERRRFYPWCSLTIYQDIRIFQQESMYPLLTEKTRADRREVVHQTDHIFSHEILLNGQLPLCFCFLWAK